MSNKNVNYKHTSVIHENYWFQDLPNTIFNLDYALKIFPEQSMTYPEKINSLVRLSISLGLILGLFYSNYLYLYIPIITMLMTYLLYIFRLEHVENTLAQKGPHSGLSHLKNNNNNVNNKLNNNSNTNSNINFTKEELKKLQKTLGLSNEDLRKEGLDLNTMSGEDFQNVLNIKTCSKPSLTLLCSPSQKQTERCHPTEIRPLRIREYARIQTFDDTYKFHGSLSSQYKQIGNAVPVELARRVGLSIIKCLSK